MNSKELILFSFSYVTLEVVRHLFELRAGNAFGASVLSPRIVRPLSTNPPAYVAHDYSRVPHDFLTCCLKICA
jgi:hypothetical protein